MEPVILQQAFELQPVCGWDGKLAYAELENLSSSVRKYLLSLGLSSEEYDPFCFEKSKWVVIAQLARVGLAIILGRF